MSEHTLCWMHDNPFVLEWQIDKTHIDHYEHVNNVAYVTQIEKLSWAHSNDLGLHFSDYKTLNRAMVIKRHELNYHLPTHLGDKLLCATWIIHCDSKLTLKRQFQFICPKRNKTVFDATTTFVCVSLDKGTPKRMPSDFSDIYGKASIAL